MAKLLKKIYIKLQKKIQIQTFFKFSLNNFNKTIFSLHFLINKFI